MVCASRRAKGAERNSAPAIHTVFRRLFIVLKPNFRLQLSAWAASDNLHLQVKDSQQRNLKNWAWVTINTNRSNDDWKRMFAVSLSTPATSQEPAAQGPVIKSEVSLVNIFATVRDKKKHIVPTLKKEDFHVFEDDQEQKIAFFANERALPITLGLLIDTSRSEENRLPAEQEVAAKFLDQVLRKGDEAMVISFGTDVDLLSEFTDDRAQLDRAIRSARINAPNVSMVNAGPLPPESRTRGLRGTAFYDAVWRPKPAAKRL